MTPRELKSELDKYVIGQEDAKRIVSIVLTNYLMRSNVGLTLPKENIILAGASGCGKTYIAEKACELLGVQHFTVDMSKATPSGYKGSNLAELFEPISILDTDKPTVIILDEFDKLTAGTWGSSKQHDLLRILEGDVISTDKVNINTDHMMFIACGAFQDKLVEKKHLGFAENKNKEEVHNNVKSSGIITELLGRFVKTVYLDALTEEQLKEILTTADDCILEHYAVLFAFTNADYDLDSDELIDRICKKAIKLGTGARGLQTIAFEEFENAMFESDHDYMENVVFELDEELAEVYNDI